MADIHNELASEVVHNIVRITDIEDWMDDRVLCANATIVMRRFQLLSDGKKRVEVGELEKKVELMWCGWEIIAAMKYITNPAAKKEFIDYLANQIECECDMVLDTLAGVDEGFETIVQARVSIKRQSTILALCGINPNDVDAVTKYAPINHPLNSIP